MIDSVISGIYWGTILFWFVMVPSAIFGYALTKLSGAKITRKNERGDIAFLLYMTYPLIPVLKWLDKMLDKLLPVPENNDAATVTVIENE